jgi:uncharacterized phage protein (TIGR02216 family)
VKDEEMAADHHAAAACFSAGAMQLLGLMARVAGWRPDEFWAATPADVRTVLGGWVEGDAAAPVDGASLAAMMERFPDG